ncbi:MAG: hypothetical protein IT422_29345 [Pirellulaceae bacterium]|nr:hypothetical protein [Pirellulaceae bacterium]
MTSLNRDPNIAESEPQHIVPWLCRLILILTAVIQLSRIVQVQSTTGEVPFFSANDRSRWCTIAALAVTGSYEIDDLIEIRDPNTRRRTWYTIDMVRHRGTDGKQHYYSSKPPLLPTLYTAVYIAIRAVTGATLMSDPFLVVPILLVIVNLIPLVAWWWLMLRWWERQRLSAWSTIVLCLFMAWGTYLTTFVSSLNNHLPAALSVGLSLWCIDRIVSVGDHRWRWFVLCGLATSFAAANELPALSWVAAVAGILIFVDARRTIVGYVPALLPVAAAFFVTNYAAHDRWIPAYAHRDVGAKLFEFVAEPGVNIEQLPIATLTELLPQHGIEFSNEITISAARRPGIYEVWDASNELRLALRRLPAPSRSVTGNGSTDAEADVEMDQPTRIGVYEWGDWYDYPGSYWTSERKQGVDKGEPNQLKYALHALIGHHGIFSLTPFWLVALWGVVVVWRERLSWQPWRDQRLLIVAAIVVTSLVSIGFYLARPLEDRNYGGVASGFRWAFWLVPLWLLLAMIGLRNIRSFAARRSVECLLLISAFSACFAWSNPWVSPWLMQLWKQLGWTASL